MRKDVERLSQAVQAGADDLPEGEQLVPQDQANGSALRKRGRYSRPMTDTTQNESSEGPASEPDKGYLEDYFRLTSSLLVAVDEQFKVYDLNPSAAKALGFVPQEARSLHCKEVLLCRNLNGTVLCGTSNCPLVRVTQHAETIADDELFLGARPGSSTEYAVDVGPACIAARPGAVFVARDLTALKVANQVRANFVSMVSHELRTPLNSVHGFVDLLMQGHMGDLSEEQRKYLGYAQEGIQQLMTIVEDILFMTRSDSGQFEMKPQKVNSRVLTRQVLNSLKLQALKAAVILDKDIATPTPSLYADPQRMQQVLNNLVTNAIKFTPPHGTVTIRVRPHPEQKDMVHFSVIDTGDGIPPEDQPHIFERFYQSNHATQSKMGGYGLGLSIARLIVEQHGGEISFESVPGKGTTFFFTAPLYTGQDEVQR
ncbi:MAG TPA: HAMP domain-containing sensor histidine kinase [Ktedonobacteraceae bacterium]|nr:HAMP domain-containing sensor histidine kinase [Ktedonobacteraceae bacterium]